MAGTVGGATWSFRTTAETLLSTLAWLAYIDQQQREPVNSSLDLAEIDGDDGCLSEAATNTTDVLAQSHYTGLKKRFLDRLAEVFARKKLPVNFVSCTALLEKEDEAVVFVSRNVKFDQKDDSFQTDCANCMESLVKGKLWSNRA